MIGGDLRELLLDQPWKLSDDLIRKQVGTGGWRDSFREQIWHQSVNQIRERIGKEHVMDEVDRVIN